MKTISPTLSRSLRDCGSRLQRISILLLTCQVLSLALGCGASGSGATSQPGSPTQLAVAPGTVILSPKGQQQFTATIQGTSNSGVIWSASAGTISSNGIFTAPAGASNGTRIFITATSVADSTQYASSTVTIQPTAPLAILSGSLSAATVNLPYTGALEASGGTAPYQWTISAGSLASGIQLQATTGTLSGTASQTGTYTFTAKVTDALSNSATQSYTLSVSANSAFDGPAELPRVYLSTTLADTPAPGANVSVNSGDNLQTALNNASCGETIELQAGATFTGAITFPAKECDDQNWIIVRTSTPDASLPPEGTRMTPCYVGVASLPGRPTFACAQPQHLLATINFSGAGSGPVSFANGANHYRLLGLEITRTRNNGMPVVALVSPQIGGSMTQIVLDRLYIHGTPTDETRRGVDLTGGTSVSVQDSYISDFHCSVEGSCTDSQAVSGGNGLLPSGPYRIDDNFLEAAGECILFGGSSATQTPADIEIRFNHLFKPMFWLQGQPGYSGPAFIVKNHFELKNAQRVLFDSNMLDDTWGGFTQHGYSVVLTPRNQGGENGGNVCPVCQVTDVTVRYVTISHVGGVFQIANALTLPNGIALAGERYSIHDVIADDINGAKYAGYGDLAQISTVPQPLLQNVMINHVTAFAPTELFNVGAPGNVQMPGFTFTNSIVDSGQYPMWSTGSFGLTDCAHADIPLSTMQQCFSGYSFAYNAILAPPAAYPPSKWPSGNWFYSSAAAMEFTNYNNGNGGNYELLPSSPGKNAASDGADLGANVSSVLSAIAAVQ